MTRLLTCAFAVALILPPAAFAGEPSTSDTQVKVRYNDLDLRDRADAAALLHRLDKAATEACGASDASLREYQLAVQASACHRRSLERAVAALHDPNLSALAR